MTEFLFFVVVLVVIWIARSAAMRARNTESVVSKLTSRVFSLEEELKQLRKLMWSDWAGAVEFLIGQLPITRRRRAAFVVPTTLGSCLLVAAFPYRDSVLITPVCTLWHGSKWIKLSLTG